jgi:predicted FMN-binding regulatory protein PaiB
MAVVDEVAIIKVAPKTMHGKYKIGQHMNTVARTNLAKKILTRNSPTAKETLKIMGFEIAGNDLKLVDEPLW